MPITRERITQSDALKIADRCDQCGAQAFVRVVFKHNRDLMFCGHHYQRHESALMTHHPHVMIRDERDKISSKPSVSANAA